MNTGTTVTVTRSKWAGVQANTSINLTQRGQDVRVPTVAAQAVEERQTEDYPHPWCGRPTRTPVFCLSLTKRKKEAKRAETRTYAKCAALAFHFFSSLIFGHRSNSTFLLPIHYTLHIAPLPQCMPPPPSTTPSESLARELRLEEPHALVLCCVLVEGTQ